MSMISPAEALFSKTQRAVLGVLFGKPEKSFYANEIVRLARTGVGAVQRELERLAGSGLVTIRRIGNQKHYQANAKSPLFRELRGIAGKALVLPAHASPAITTQGAATDIPGTLAVLREDRPAYQAGRKGAKLHIPRGRLAQVCRKYGIRKLSLFGSAARNEMMPSSDIDLLIEFEPGSGTSLFDFPEIRKELSQLFGHRPIDLVAEDVLKNPFRRNSILPDLKVLYEA